jgi:hypothetical protein
MIKFKNYIFYRTYEANKLWGNPPVFSSSLYLSCIEFILTFPILGFILELFRHDTIYYGKLIFVLLIIIVILNFKYYFNAYNLKKILLNNENNKYNKIISKWWFFCILPLSMIIGFGSHILISIHIVKEYNLQGFLYELFW